MLLDTVEGYRLDATDRLDEDQRSELGQFLTPPAVAGLMASLFGAERAEYRLLDPGAGVGSLTAAFVAEMCARPLRPQMISVTAFELDPRLLAYLRQTLDECGAACEAAGVAFHAEALGADFIQVASAWLREEMFVPAPRFNAVITNPPYRKIASDSGERAALRAAGMETSNLYSGFVALSVRLLEPGGEIVAITPRSFCNGTYFKPFRRDLLARLSLRRVHVFESRQAAFRSDGVLQENIIFHGEAGAVRQAVTVSSSYGPSAAAMILRDLPSDAVVDPHDPDAVIHIAIDDAVTDINALVGRDACSPPRLGLEVSTGRVVDFRARALLRRGPDQETAPLIYPCNFHRGAVQWPRCGKKPQALAALPGIEDLVVHNETYVLVKRFSSKEEPRRIRAAVYRPSMCPPDSVGFENHLNYFHRRGHGLPIEMAKGLSAYLNSTAVDRYFRQFSGHTQVNAGDLRRLPYPVASALKRLGAGIGWFMPDQEELDQWVAAVLNPDTESDTLNRVSASQKIEEAIEILRDIGFPSAQQNERSALTLLALLNLAPETSWASAGARLCGITQMMGFFRQYYGKNYAPNTRETVRRQSVHQFLDGGLILSNPDEPERPINSGKTVYQIAPEALALLRTFGTSSWADNVSDYVAKVSTLSARYAQDRIGHRIRVQLTTGEVIPLSPGGQNMLVERVITDFCEIFLPGARPVYVGDTDEKFAFFEESVLKGLGVHLDPHGKMPDVIYYDEARGWLVLIEAVTSHGPVDPKRRSDLARLFGGATVGLVFVTAFLDRKTMQTYVSDIAWETELWVAEAPEHLVHFNGERFLGPHH